MDQQPLSEPFLGENPTIEQQWKALRLNVQTCYERWARAEGREGMFRAGDILGTYNQLTLPSEEALQDDQLIERILNWYRDQQPLHGAICWYLHPKPPAKLGARLFARGVSPNWNPYWMWCDLRQIQNHRPDVPTFEIQVIGPAELSSVSEEIDSTQSALIHMYPQQVWRVRALQQGQGVGGCTLSVTTGEWGIGGLFDMWVSEEARNQGIGTTLAQTACELAQQLGCHHVVLNATEMGKPIYSRVGFQSWGYGYSWYLDADTLAQPAPTDDVVTFLEALGLGEIDTLDETFNRLPDNILHEPTLNGMTPLELTVRCHQPASADWLVAHGIIPDIISAWDLGWQERLPALLAAHPELVKQRGGSWDATPLHIAIERNDIALVQLLLTVPNDLKSKDAVFHSTPMGWARHFQRPEIIALLKQARVHRGPSSQPETSP